ncbi:MAG: twin-arginine translocase subunit TatB [Fuerstiella sp.]|nr:twin-arginine translocase subunit TatB [Fuerstiella sp.]
MFDIGFWELVILFGLGLMVLGPERMPKVAAQLGRWAGQARRMARNLSSQFREELEPIQKSVNSVNEGLNQNITKDWSTLRPEPGENNDAEKTDDKSDDASPDKDT